jgi:hypothetical protein
LKTAPWKLAAALLLLVAVAGCKKAEQAGGTAATETISPAQPQPEQTGTGDLTQTVDVEDSRSEAEGAALTDPDHATTDTVTTSTTATTTTAPPPPTTTTR